MNCNLKPLLRKPRITQLSRKVRKIQADINQGLSRESLFSLRHCKAFPHKVIAANKQCTLVTYQTQVPALTSHGYPVTFKTVLSGRHYNYRALSGPSADQGVETPHNLLPTVTKSEKGHSQVSRASNLPSPLHYTVIEHLEHRVWKRNLTRT